MDDRTSQFLVSVGRLCADAHVGVFTVCLTLDGGEEVVGVPDPPPAAEGPEQLDETGYRDAIALDGRWVALSEVIEVSVRRPTAT